MPDVDAEEREVEEIGTWTLRILGYQPAGRHLESGYLNLFEVRVSCRGIGQKVWRAEKAELKPFLFLLKPPASLSLQGATSSLQGARGSSGDRGSCTGCPRAWQDGWEWSICREVEGQKEGSILLTGNNFFFSIFSILFTSMQKYSCDELQISWHLFL